MFKPQYLCAEIRKQSDGAACRVFAVPMTGPAPDDSPRVASPGRIAAVVGVLIVLLLFAILAQMAGPSMNQAASRKRHSVECMANLRMLGHAMMQYVTADNPYLPPGDDEDGFAVLLRSGAFNTPNCLLCPAADSGIRPNYRYFGGVDSSLPYRVVVAMDPPGAHGPWFDVLFSDGSVERYRLGPDDPENVAAMLKTVYRAGPRQEIQTAQIRRAEQMEYNKKTARTERKKNARK